MNDYVNVRKLLEEVDAMKKRGTLLARGGVTQKDLAIQIKGIIVNTAMENTVSENKGSKNTRKFRVVWVPQKMLKEVFFIPVDSPEEGAKILKLLTIYDIFQFQSELRCDYENAGGFETWDEEKQGWITFDLDEYCSQCKKAGELLAFDTELFKQLDFEKINKIKSKSEVNNE